MTTYIPSWSIKDRWRPWTPSAATDVRHTFALAREGLLCGKRLTEAEMPGYNRAITPGTGGLSGTHPKD